MQRGYRLYIILLGLFLAGHHPDVSAQAKQPSTQERSASAIESIAAQFEKQADQAEQSPGNNPCEPGDDLRNSDLCAQWKAADAAANSAWWAAFSGWFGGLSFLGVLAALGLAFHSNWIARDTAKRQLRAYVGYSNDWYHSEFAIGQELLLKPKIVNTGETPAQNVLWQAQVQTIPDPNAEGAFNIDPMAPGSRSTLGRGQWTQTTLRVMPNAESYAMVMSGAKGLYVFGTVDYEDVFGNDHTTKFRLRLIPEEQRWVMCPEGNEVT